MSSIRKEFMLSLEDDQDIVVKGPLSDVYTQALNVAYKKDETGTTLMDDKGQPVPITVEEATAIQAEVSDAGNPTAVAAALESAAIDVMVAQQLAEGMAPPEPTDAFQTVYGVAKDAVNNETIVEVSQELVEADDASSVAIIIDEAAVDPNSTAQTGLPEQQVEVITAALECLAEAHGAKVYRSLKEFAQSRKSRR